MNKYLTFALTIVIGLVFFTFASQAVAYDTYTSGCDNCHGGFRDGVSTKGSVFPGDDKHQMHRSSNEMDTDCNLCHTQTGDDPFIGSSAGTANNPGYGCVGCHGRVEDGGNDGISAGYGAGLRQHHNNAGITSCAICHTDANPINYTPVGEHVRPPYFGTVDTKADMACNPVQEARKNQNWTLTDFVGLDDDGDLFYDAVGDSDCMVVVSIPGDLNADGMADILWRNSGTGENRVYFMNGASIDQNLSINVVTSAWEIVGNRDHNADGSADILWRNSTTGQNWMYLMSGDSITSSRGINTISDQQWKVAGTGDYNGDGSADILWRHSGDGRNWMYLMNGAQIATSLSVNTISDVQWEVVGNGDYDGDGNSDVLWRHSATGQNWMYLMNGNIVASSLAVNTIGDVQWQVVGNGDYNGDGNADILWRHMGDGRNWMYLMNGNVITGSMAVNTISDMQWQVVGNGDYNGDGNADIMWRHAGDGRNWVYLMNGATITIGGSLAVNTISDMQWQVVGNAD